MPTAGAQGPPLWDEIKDAVRDAWDHVVGTQHERAPRKLRLE